MDLQPYLQASRHIDFHHPAVARLALRLAEGGGSSQAVAQRCYVHVRDHIQHSWDHRREPLTCTASDVLLQGTGYCYAKSHLLAALLRANGIAAGFCYQRLSSGDSGAPYCLHGLNAVYLPDHGWYRIDARGNKPGVQAEFCPPREQLAFAIREADEADLPEIWPEPLELVTQVLTSCATVAEAQGRLPDIALVPRRQPARA